MLVDGDLLRVYAHSGHYYDAYDNLSKTFGTFENDIYVMVNSPNLVDPDVLEDIRSLAFDLELNEYAVGTMSPFTLRKPDGSGGSVPAVPEGMLNAAEIAAHPRLQGMVMGTNDLAKELNSRFRADRLPMMAGLGLCLLAARAHGRVIVDGVFNAFKDEEGLRAECEQGRDMGFDGKTLIHPAQLAIANEVFAPSEAEVDLARRQIEAFDEAQAQGKGVAVVDGRIVENLHVETARVTLAKAAAIAALAG